MYQNFTTELEWATLHMTRTRIAILWLKQAKSGLFILNVGQVAKEIGVPFLKQQPIAEPILYVNAYQVGGKTIYLLTDGSIFNLTAGYSDSINAFDVTLAVMASGIGHIVAENEKAEKDVYLLPQAVWQKVL